MTARTAAVVVVHRFGRLADIARLHALGARHGLLVLEQGESEAPYDEIAQRRERAAYLHAKLRGVRTPDDGDGHTYQQYVVRVPGNGRPDQGRVQHMEAQGLLVGVSAGGFGGDAEGAGEAALDLQQEPRRRPASMPVPFSSGTAPGTAVRSSWTAGMRAEP
ncbi:hypothetical protein SVIOM74S_05124 [Streptomyces violarus]